MPSPSNVAAVATTASFPVLGIERSSTLAALARLAGAISIAILALTLAACGGDDPAAAEKGSSAQRPAPAKTPTTNRGCQAQLGDLVRSLNTLRRRLAFGLSYERYLYDVRKVKAAYDEVPVDDLTLNCVISVATPSERALNHYIEAANTWGNCLATAGCESTSVEPKLQRKWRQASAFVSTALKTR